ncbi:MAG: cbb3-type cytochrome c oxidase N-terminal domain-containing protein [Psychroflexus sp.]|nr:cbb3-type cytochrome c oxidase N-terminal domain-containing protein [Psychroflexus sp.]
MRNLSSYLRVIAFVGIAFLGIEYLVQTEEGKWAILENPYAGVFLGVVILFAIAIEVSIASLKNILYYTMDEAARERYDARQAEKSERFVRLKERLQKMMTRSKPVEEEHEIVLDHNYDGIRELDNKLPPWWLYGFYLTILFAAVYLVRFHIFDDYTQKEEYEQEVAEAKAAIEEYKKNNKDLIDIESVQFVTNEDDLSAGKQIYTTNCVACHKADGGGGIGPNLTDKHWILGGGIKNVYKTISKGGRSGKGMVAWENQLSAEEMQQVASYVLTLQGKEPADPKDPQGEKIWELERDEEGNIITEDK